MESGPLDLFDGPPWTESTDLPGPTHRRTPLWWFLIAAVLVGAFLVWLSLVLPVPGGSVLVPTGIVVGVGVAIGAGGGIVLLACRELGGSGVFAASVFLLTALTGIWTFELSLPFQMAWASSSSSSQVKQILGNLERGPKNVDGVPLDPCQVVRTGSIGPLSAPFDQCATSTYVGAFGSKRVNFVLFTLVGVRTQGLAYTNIGPATFEDECYRHLVGDWWAFNGGDPANPAGPCSLGYSFHGGG
ncbi:MAG TPA: hypothetical protein VKR22_08385 [Acidimicrobiales bacterium]|nr:hypothetical protein [Acidimicrobiales bacterium]